MARQEDPKQLDQPKHTQGSVHKEGEHYSGDEAQPLLQTAGTREDAEDFLTQCGLPDHLQGSFRPESKHRTVEKVQLAEEDLEQRKLFDGVQSFLSTKLEQQSEQESVQQAQLPLLHQSQVSRERFDQEEDLKYGEQPGEQPEDTQSPSPASHVQQSSSIVISPTFGELIDALPPELRFMICPNAFTHCDHTFFAGRPLDSSWELQCQMCHHLFPISLGTASELVVLADTLNCPEQLNHWYVATKLAGQRADVHAVRLMIMDSIWEATKGVATRYGGSYEGYDAWADAARPVMNQWMEELRQWLPRGIGTVYIDLSIGHLLDRSIAPDKWKVLTASQPSVVYLIQRIWQILRRACLRAMSRDSNFPMVRVVVCRGDDMEVSRNSPHFAWSDQLAYEDTQWVFV